MIWNVCYEGLRFRIHKADADRTWLVQLSKRNGRGWATITMKHSHAACVTWLRENGW